jgi:hypothetical protein
LRLGQAMAAPVAVLGCAFRKPHPLDSQKKRESDHDRN